MAAKSSYDAAERDIGLLFTDYLEGGPDQPCLVLSSSSLEPIARDALTKSLDALGYGTHACAFASLAPLDPDVEGGDIQLDAQALFLLVEGLDPLFVICADKDAARRLGESYRAEFRLDAAVRAFGRPAVTFKDLPALLGNDDGKRKAWQLLKTLRKR